MNQNNEANTMNATYETLKSIGERFVAFLHKAGQSETPLTQDDVAELFTPLCTKTVNGEVLFTASDQFLSQIAGCRETVGKWAILETLWSIASPEDRACTLQFTWTGDTIGAQITMVTLFLDEAGKIFQFHEVFGQYDQGNA